MNVKALILGIVLGGMISFGTYFFLPPPQTAYAKSCDESYIINRILYCIDGSSIRGGNLSTSCNG
jgi:hypothetical protein